MRINIKMSGSELWPRKVELICALKTATIRTMSILHITMKPAFVPMKTSSVDGSDIH